MMISNNDFLLEVANGLGKLNERITYIIDTIPNHIAANGNLLESQQTKEIDILLVVDCSSPNEEDEFLTLVREYHFIEVEHTLPFSLWKYNNIKIGIFTTNKRDFSSKEWYKNRCNQELLPNGHLINKIPTLPFIASLFEVIKDKADLRGITELEIIVILMYIDADFIKICENERDTDLIKFLYEHSNSLISRPNLSEELRSVNDNNTLYVESLFEMLAGNKFYHLL